MTDKHAREAENPEATRPGLKTLAVALAVGMMIYAFYNWSDVKAGFFWFS